MLIILVLRSSFIMKMIEEWHYKVVDLLVIDRMVLSSLLITWFKLLLWTSEVMNGQGVDYIKFYTGTSNSTTEQFKIDSSGRISKPNQPAFSVRRNSSQDIPHNTNTKVQWNTEIFDVGGHFDSSTPLMEDLRHQLLENIFFWDTYTFTRQGRWKQNI